MLKFIVRMWNYSLDILFPHRRVVAELMALSSEEFLARAARAEGRTGKNIISLFDYGDPMVRAAIWELKYRGNRRIAELLGELLYDEILGFLEEYAPLTNFKDPLLIPLPLSKRRKRERGFNQCELLCNELMRLDGTALSSSLEGESCLPADWQAGRGGGSSRTFTLSVTALRKVKDTPSQTKAQNRAARLKNLAGCFGAEQSEVNGRNIILIDDVATTGATLHEARLAARRAGARKVIAFTIAH